MVVTALVFCAPSSAAAQARDPDPWLGSDKALHFGASALIAGAGYGVSAPFFEHSRLPPLLIGGGLGVVAGVGKELYDATGRGHPSAKDLVWDGLGVTAGLLLALGVDVLIRGWHLPARAESSTGRVESSTARLVPLQSGVLLRF